jgi:hypothetical protein
MMLPKAVPARWRWIACERVRPGHVVFVQDGVSRRPMLAFGDAAASHLVATDAVSGLPRAQRPDSSQHVLELAAADSLELELGAPIAADSSRINLIGCVGVSESGPVLCARGGVDRWGEVPEYFHLASWKPLGLDYPGLLDALWFAQWQLVYREGDGNRLRLLGSAPVPGAQS